MLTSPKLIVPLQTACGMSVHASQGSTGRTGPEVRPRPQSLLDHDAEDEDVLVGSSAVAVPRVRPRHVHLVAARRGGDARVVAEETRLRRVGLRARIRL